MRATPKLAQGVRAIMDRIAIGALQVSRFIIGGNPFSGFSHQGVDRDREMQHYYTTARIKDTLREAENLGINTRIGRADRHLARVLLEYWDEGGQVQWIAQTCPEYGAPINGVNRAIAGGAAACYIHGGAMDFLLAQDRLDEARVAVERIKAAGLMAGVAGHNPDVFRWAETDVDVDFYMCSYYNPIPREQNAAHVSGVEENYDDGDRQAMTALIKTLSKPVIHYKVLAAGRHHPRDGFDYVARHLRSIDAVSVGVFTKDNPDMLQQDVLLFAQGLATHVTAHELTESRSLTA